MGSCCAQNSNLPAKKTSEEVFEDILQKSGRSIKERTSKPIEHTASNRDNELYYEKSKLLLSNNPKINVSVCYREQEVWNTLIPFEYDRDNTEGIKLELREVTTYDHGEKYYGFW